MNRFEKFYIDTQIWFSDGVFTFGYYVNLVIVGIALIKN